MSAPIAVATLFASQLLLAGSVLAAENNDRLDPRNDAFEQNHPDQYHSWKATSESKH
ncbi:ammonia-forming cytochrome c nitrite reductase subunit c552, partial [Vibrio parahaemolyticus]|nr:ammonia-forming cytochrome c nitrite reductase subunit c552 [Vibrio parahaemolyticus]MCF9430584.1 ammonia-forming cytochrome c nitrite reductase subunit c552 [Vibrio parahaemolyticus]